MTDQGVIATRDATGGVATLVINRPERMNSLDRRTQVAFREALNRCRDARVIIITGEGDRSFCAGVDRKELAASSPDVREDDVWLEVCNEVRHHPSVVIAAVNGYALGGGLTLVNAADIAIAAARAEFGVPEITFATFPRLSGTSSVRRIAPKRSSWLALTGDRIDAATAEQWGLINLVVENHRLRRASEELAAKVAGYDETALRWTKRGLHEVELSDWDDALAFGSYVRAMVKQDRGLS